MLNFKDELLDNNISEIFPGLYQLHGDKDNLNHEFTIAFKSSCNDGECEDDEIVVPNDDCNC